MTKRSKAYGRSESKATLIDELLIQQLKESLRLASIRGQLVRFFLGAGAIGTVVLLAWAVAH